MSGDWMRPITEPLPGPVASEELQLTADERARIAAVAEPVRLVGVESAAERARPERGTSASTFAAEDRDRNA